MSDPDYIFEFPGSAPSDGGHFDFGDINDPPAPPSIEGALDGTIGALTGSLQARTIAPSESTTLKTVTFRTPSDGVGAPAVGNYDISPVPATVVFLPTPPYIEVF